MALPTVRRPSPAMAVFGAIAAAFAVGSITSASESGNSLCIFRRCTGGYCPGCGGSRAAVALVRGRVGDAWSLHPWVPLIALQLVVAGAAWATGRRFHTNLVTWVLLANLVLGVGIWVLRLSTAAIPVPFA